MLKSNHLLRIILFALLLFVSNASRAVLRDASLARGVGKVSVDHFKENQAPIPSIASGNRDVSFVKIRFSSANGSSDECVLNFLQGASGEYEWMFDALKMESMIPTSAECALMSSDDFALSIDSREFPQTETGIPVYIDMPVSGNYELEIAEVQNLPFGFCAQIQDLFNDDIKPLTQGEAFTLENQEAYTGVRFIIRFNFQVNVNVTNPTCALSEDGSIMLDCEGMNWDISLMNENGMGVLPSEDLLEFIYLAGGTYQIQLLDPLHNCAGISAFFEVVEPPLFEASLNTYSADFCNNHSNGSIEIGVENSGEYNFIVTNAEGSEIINDMADEGNLFISGLPGSIYSIEINSGCGSAFLISDLRDPQAVAAEILQGEVNISLQPGENQYLQIAQSCTVGSSIEWSLNGTPISADEYFSYTFTEAGEFLLVLTANNGTCTSTDSLLIAIETEVGVTEMKGTYPVDAFVSCDFVSIAMNETTDEQVSMHIFDSVGKALWSAQSSMQKGHVVETSTVFLPSGVYVLKCSLNGREVLSRKFIK